MEFDNLALKLIRKNKRYEYTRQFFKEENVIVECALFILS